MYKITAWFLIATFLLHPVCSLFATEATHSELLSQMSLQKHYEETLRRRETQKYNLELELQTILRMEERGSLSETYQRRKSQIEASIRQVNDRIASNQELLVTVNRNIDQIRQDEYGATGTTKDETLAVTVAAATSPAIINGQTALTGAIRSSTTMGSLPNNGVIGTGQGTVTRVEQWNNGKFYEVTRYSEGPNKGRFAPGGKREISPDEVRKMGSSLKTAHVESLQSNLTHSTDKISSLRAQLKQTKNPEVRAQLKDQINQTKRVQSELKAELRQAKSSPVTDFVKSGVSFAAMSVAVTGGYNIVRQVIDNGGDISRVDYRQAFEFVTTKEYWIANAGTFTGGMIGSAVTSFLPGPFKVLGAIAGASVGHQIATGQFGQTDWAQVAAQTIGSTIGFYLGAFIGSFLGPFAPIAIIVFATLGSILGAKALEWLRSTFSPDLQGISMDSVRSREEAELEALADMIPTENLADLRQMPITQLREELWISYENYRLLQEAGTQIQDPEQRLEWESNMRSSQVRYEFIRKLISEKKSEFFEENSRIPATIPADR